MEPNASYCVISGDGIVAPSKNQKGHDASVDPKKKKRGLMHVFRVALFMIKSKRSKKPKPACVDSVSTWHKVFGLDSMHPLHMQTYPRSPARVTESATTCGGGVENLEVFTPPVSPTQESVASPSSSCETSQFASATNLKLLDEGNENHQDDEEGAAVAEDKEGDGMIDLKAEKFIAEFYQQMKLQNEAYGDHYNRRINGGQ